MVAAPIAPVAADAATMRIFFRDLAVQVGIGIHDFELASPQRVLVDIDLWVDRRQGVRAGKSDDIADTLDYDGLRDAVQALARARRYNTQESFCWEVLKACLTFEMVRAARVSTCKPDVYTDTAGVGVELFEAKQSLDR